jgi:hypothetical protein
MVGVMELSPGTIGAISATIAVPIFMRIMRNIKSLQYAPTLKKNFEQLKKEYSKWERCAGFVIIIFTAVIGYGLWKVLRILSALQISYLEPSKYIIALPAYIWALPALFLAICFSAIPAHFLYLGLLGKQRYTEYIEYSNRKFGIDGWKLFSYMFYTLIPICIVAVLLMLDTYVRVTDRSFVVNDFLAISEKEYRFDEIDSLELKTFVKFFSGNIRRENFYSIGFKDGNNYDFYSDYQDLSFEKQTEIAKFLSKSSNIGIKINEPYQTRP